MLHQSPNTNIQLSSNMTVSPPLLTTQLAPLISHYYTWNHKWRSFLFEELWFETRSRHGQQLYDGILWPVKQRVSRLFQRPPTENIQVRGLIEFTNRGSEVHTQPVSSQFFIQPVTHQLLMLVASSKYFFFYLQRTGVQIRARNL